MFITKKLDLFLWMLMYHLGTDTKFQNLFEAVSQSMETIGKGFLQWFYNDSYHFWTHSLCCRGPKTQRVFFTHNYLTRSVVQIQVIVISSQWLSLGLIVSSCSSDRGWTTKVIDCWQGICWTDPACPVTIINPDNVKQDKYKYSGQSSWPRPDVVGTGP